MSSNEDDDEFSDAFSDEDSTENEYNENLKAQANKLKAKRMQAARPSTIVHVSTGPLEMHLQSMKKQLKEHRALIEHPPFLDDLMIEVNKICGLVRKIEHCQLDINNVRETMVVGASASTQKGVNPSSETMTEKVNHLFKDVEMVRAVIRRIDVHQAIDANVLVRVKQLAKKLQALKEYSEKMYTNNMRVIQDELKGEIKSVVTKIQQMDDLNVEKLNEVLRRIQHAEENIHDGQKEETELIAQKVAFLEDNLTADFYTFRKQVDEQLETTKKISIKAFMKLSQESLTTGMKLMKDYLRRAVLNKMKKRFTQWQNFDPYGKLSLGRDFIVLMNKAHKKMFTRSALYEWKSYHEKQKARERMSVYMSNIIKKWKAIAFPVISKRFQTWKRYCIFMRFHIIERKALMSSSDSVVLSKLKQDEKEKYSNVEYDQLISKLNPALDIEGSFQLTGLYVDRIYNKISTVNDDLKKSNDTTRRIGHRVEGVKNDLNETLEKRCGDVENNQKSHSQLLNNKMKDMRQAQENFKEETSKNFSNTTDEVHRLESLVYELSIKVEGQTSRLERLFTLHQKMLDKMDVIEKTQASHEAQLAKVNNQMSKISDSNARNDAEIMLHKHMTEKSIDSIKESINDVQYAAKDCNSKLQAVLSNQVGDHTAVSNLTKEFKSKISNIESWLNVTAPKPPSPKILVALALKFEDRAVKKHSQDPSNTFAVSMSTELAKDIATCAHWLVYHIVEATDVDVLTRVMKGPQDTTTVYDASDPSNALHNTLPTEPATHKGKKSTLTHEEFCTTTRESMLLRYLEKYQKELDQARDDVGLVRKEARSLFLKRFIDSLDLSLQKHDVIVLNTSSAMGRNPGHVSGRPNESSGPAACMACDRPLRMRTTSRSIGELYDKLLLSGKKSSALKREVLRNQITENSPTSPTHNYVLGPTSQPIHTRDPIDYNLPDDNYSELYDNISHNDDSGRKSKNVIRIRPASTSRPQSAPRDMLASSQSVTQFNNAFPQGSVPVKSPSKGGGFKSAKALSQEALAGNIAHKLPLDTSILPRHSIEDLPTSSRKILGKFEKNHNESNEHITNTMQEVEHITSTAQGDSHEAPTPQVEASITDSTKNNSQSTFELRGLRGTFVQSVSASVRPKTSDGITHPSGK